MPPQPALDRRRLPPGEALTAPQPAEGAETRVLILSGDPVFAFECEALLRVTEGLSVSSAGEHEPLRVAGAAPPDVIIADVGDGGPAGCEIVRTLTTALPEIPVIAVSGAEDGGASDAIAVRIGAQELLHRDELTPRVLVRVVRHAIERKRTEARLRHLALHDAVTGLANRVAFLDALERAQIGARALVAVLVVDVDRFRRVNDHVGQAVGDMLLRLVAERLRAAVRVQDFVARIGGDEFGIVLRDVFDASEAAVVARRIVAAMDPPMDLGVEQVHTSVSVGVALHPTCGTSVDELLSAADRAMHQARTGGRGRIEIARGRPGPEVGDEHRLERDLRLALPRGQLLLHYQPLFDARTGGIRAFEALLRWRHPELGMIRPDRFISLLEDIGHMGRVGAWVLRQAAEWTANYRIRTGRDVRVAVNVSPTQFSDDSLQPAVTAALRHSRLPADRLELEITEAAILRDAHRTGQIVGALRELGVRAALDDFGTGFSSLSHLRALPVDTLKVDRSFVQDERDLPLVAAIIGLGHRLGLTVVAEGVETEAQRAFLVEQGCDLLQGYLLGRPAMGPAWLE